MRIAPLPRLLASCALSAWTLAGCSLTDPYQRPGTWRPEGANAANLRQMLAEPAQAVWGAPEGEADGAMAAEALARLREGRRHALPEVSTQRGGGGSP